MYLTLIHVIMLSYFFFNFHPLEVKVELKMAKTHSYLFDFEQKYLQMLMF